MTVLQVAQAAALRCGLEVPSVFYNNTSRTFVELQNVVNDCAKQILDEYDWQLLKKVHTITGDGETAEFDMPSDYKRMGRDAHMWTNFMPFWNGQQVGSVDSWLAMEESEFFAAAVPMWIIYQNKFHVRPVLRDGDTLKFVYISNKIVANAGSPAPAAASFSQDDQSFVLSERMLTNCVVYNWKMRKGMDYAADLRQFGDDFSYAVGSDKGPRIIQEGRGSRFGSWQGGWPFSGRWP